MTFIPSRAKVMANSLRYG